MELPGFVEKVLFVVVLYRQCFRETKAFESLRPLIEKNPGAVNVYVYDNSPEADHRLQFATHYVHDPKNSGVGRAYNFAYVFAKEKSFRFMLLMDQDSFFSEEAFFSYSQAVATHATVQVFAPVVKGEKKVYSPFRLRRGRGISLPKPKVGIHSLENIKLINSGMLVTVDAFEKAGGYDERFPLDFSDIVFCDRLAACNTDVCILDTIIHHAHSSATTSADPKKRFETYLRALRMYKHCYKKDVSFWLGGFPTAARLSTQYRDRWFIEKFLDLRI
ncbi:MAG TPA: hypothetical protein VGD40_09285 [Chryseosolibacter sp.]